MLLVLPVLHGSLVVLFSIYLLPLQLTFEDDLRISNMHSAEGEVVPFHEKLYPTGNVENWLLEVENMMKSSLRDILFNALQDYPEVRYLICKIR